MIKRRPVNAVIWFLCTHGRLRLPNLLKEDCCGLPQMGAQTNAQTKHAQQNADKSKFLKR
jgi:hypothetical protein